MHKTSLNPQFNWLYGFIWAKCSECLDGFVVCPHFVDFLGILAGELDELSITPLLIWCRKTPPTSKHQGHCSKISERCITAPADPLLFHRLWRCNSVNCCSYHSRHQLCHDVAQQLRVCLVCFHNPHLCTDIKSFYFHFNPLLFHCLVMCQRQLGKTNSSSSCCILGKEKVVISPS